MLSWPAEQPNAMFNWAFLFKLQARRQILFFKAAFQCDYQADLFRVQRDVMFSVPGKDPVQYLPEPIAWAGVGVGKERGGGWSGRRTVAH